MINSFFTKGGSLKTVNQLYNVSRIDTGSGALDMPQNKPSINYTSDELRDKFHPDKATIQGKYEQTAAAREEDALKFLANAGILEPEENPTPDLNPKVANATVIELPEEPPKLDHRLLANARVLEVNTPDLPDEIIA